MAKFVLLAKNQAVVVVVGEKVVPVEALDVTGGHMRKTVTNGKDVTTSGMTGMTRLQDMIQLPGYHATEMRWFQKIEKSAREVNQIQMIMVPGISQGMKILGEIPEEEEGRDLLGMTGIQEGFIREEGIEIGMAVMATTDQEENIHTQAITVSRQTGIQVNDATMSKPRRQALIILQTEVPRAFIRMIKV